MSRPSVLGAVALVMVGCVDPAVEQAQRLEQERAAAARLQEERESLARRYSRQAGQRIMDAIGGGQDLIVQHGQWTFDSATDELEIPMDVSFNGAFVRANNYRVQGLLTIRPDGTNARFARASANKNYLDIESTRDFLIILNDLSEALDQK